MISLLERYIPIISGREKIPQILSFMETLFFLHGGALGRRTEKNTQFFRAVTQNIPQNGSLLGIYFARADEEQEKLFFEDKERFLEIFPQKKLQYHLAKKENIAQQIQMADALYFSGGSEILLQNILQKIQLQDLVKGKIIAGSSAGANIFAKYYFTNDRNQIEEGFGILPIKTFCHYAPQKEENLQKLRYYKENLSTYPLEEEEFITLSL